MEKITYVFNQKSYTFLGECKYPAPGEKDFGKRIYQGKFDENSGCPHGLFPDQEYMLVQITIDSSIEQPSNLPQNRQYWDAADIHGDHLRQILSRSDSALLLANELQNGYDPSKGIYQVIEPVYLPVAPYLREMSDYEKLDLAKQICEALLEFCSFRMPSRILCHRDVKLGNLLLEPMADAFRVRLIDFASLCRAGGDGTIHDAVSIGNTAPEVLGLDEMGIRVCDRTDVYALAGILGELFGNRNPIALWCERNWPTKPEEKEKSINGLRKAYRTAMRNDNSTNGISWLEKQLGSEFRWNNTLPQDLQDRIIALFRKMIPLNPTNRIPLDEVLEGLDSLLRDMVHQGLAERRCSKLYLQTTALVFDRRLLSRHRASYLHAIDKIVKSARRQAHTAGFAGAQFTVLACGKADEICKETIEKECFEDHASSVHQIMSMLQPISDAEHGKYSVLPKGLEYIGRHQSHYIHADTTIHVFAPDDKIECPQDSDLAAISHKLNRTLEATLFLHSVNPTETGNWYSRSEKLSVPNPIWTVVTPEKDSSYVPPYDITTGPEAWFIVRNGKKIYVGKKV